MKPDRSPAPAGKRFEVRARCVLPSLKNGFDPKPVFRVEGPDTHDRAEAERVRRVAEAGDAMLAALLRMRDAFNAPGFKSNHPDGQPFAVADAFSDVCAAIDLAEGRARA